MRKLLRRFESRQDALGRLTGQIGNQFDYLLSALDIEQWLWFGQKTDESAADVCLDGGGREQKLAVRRVFWIAEEQPGCVHAGMDLYKWAAKLGPLIESSLLLDCFALAVDARVLDMRASPYDLRDFGFAPIPGREREDPRAEGPGVVR